MHTRPSERATRNHHPSAASPREARASQQEPGACRHLVRDALEGLGMQPIAKTRGSRGLHVYVAIVCTLASVYSRRPKPLATVSAPLTWEEVESGAETEDFRMDNMPARIARVGDLWAPLAARRGRFDLARLLEA